MSKDQLETLKKFLESYPNAKCDCYLQPDSEGYALRYHDKDSDKMLIIAIVGF